jgi:acyl carrier protein
MSESHPPQPAAHVSAEAIGDWLVAYIGTELGIDPRAISREAEFAEVGLGSRHSVLLAGDLEDWLGITVPPTAAWDYPTIAALSEFLAERAGQPT